MDRTSGTKISYEDVQLVGPAIAVKRCEIALNAEGAANAEWFVDEDGSLVICFKHREPMHIGKDFWRRIAT